jgi:PAS domain S-box-containing protein
MAMTASPTLSLRDTLNWRQAFQIGIITLIFLIGYLLYYNYAAQVALQASTVTRMESDLAGWSEVMDNFLEERKLDIFELSGSHEIVGYFINQSLGMSLQYGLKESGNIITRTLDTFVKSSSSSSQRFVSLCLFDQEGRIVAESSSPPAQGGTLPYSKLVYEFSGDGVSIRLYPGSTGFIEISAQVNLNDKRVGQIVGLIPFKLIHKQFFNQKPISSVAPEMLDFIAIAGPGQLYIPPTANIKEAEVSTLLESLDIPADIQSKTFKNRLGNVSEILVIRAPLKKVPVSLIWILDSHKVFYSHSPLIFLILFGMFALAILLSAILAGRQYVNSQVLVARIEASSRIQLEIEQKNIELVNEIDQRKKVEELLMREQSLLSSLLDSIPDPIFYKSVDLRFIGGNAAFKEFVGLSQECLVGQRTEDIVSLPSARFLWEHDQKIISQGLKIRLEERSRHPNGNELLFDTVKTPYYSPSGEIIGLISISRDILERRQLANELAKQKERLDLVIQAANIGLWDWYIDSGKTYFNERCAAIIGYNLSELQPVNIDTWLALVHPDDSFKSSQHLENHFNGITEFYECECRMRHKDGRWVWVLDRGRVVERADDGRPIRMSGTHIDITRRMEAEVTLKTVNETLEQEVVRRTEELKVVNSRLLIQEKMASIGQLAAGVAHELNNPINFIQTNFATLQEYFLDIVMLFNLYKDALESITDQGQSQILDHLLKKEKEIKFGYVIKDIPLLFHESKKGFERVSHIIGTMRDFSRQDQSFGEVDINQCIENTLVISKNEYKYDTVIEKNFSQIPLVEGVTELLNQVFLNLIINSAQANSEAQLSGKGIIAITTWNDEQFVYCSFRDNGIGIPFEHLNRIFEPFFTTKPPGHGTGLGLSISYDIVVHKHRGLLTAENLKSGGAEFMVKIPVKQEARNRSSEIRQPELPTEYYEDLGT